MNESRQQRGGNGFSAKQCCFSKSLLEGIRTQNEVMTIKVRDLETKLSKQSEKAKAERAEVEARADILQKKLEE